MTDEHNSTTAGSPGHEVPPIRAHFELKVDEPVADGLRRIALEQVDVATWHAQRAGAADEHVHEVRRAAKRARAVLRLAREGIGEQPYRRINALLRDVAKDLSALRSATIRVTTLEGLTRRHYPMGASVEELHAKLLSDTTVLRASVRVESVLVDDLVGRLRLARTSLGEWKMPPVLIPMASGLQRTYRRGRLGMERAYADQSTDHLHEWRKRVKYLRHQMEVLGAVMPETMNNVAASYRELAELLGLDHDLADLEIVVIGSPDVFASSTAQGNLLDTIARLRRELQADLLPLGQRLYAQTPRDFFRVVTSGCENWGGESGSGAGLFTVPERGLL